jgi:hypothetical protein
MWGSGRIKHIRGSEIKRKETVVRFEGKGEKDNYAFSLRSQCKRKFT